MLRAMRATGQTLSTGERSAPRHGEAFLAYDKEREVMGVCYLSVDRTLCFEANGSIVELDEFSPTHWLRTPEPPDA